MAERATAVAARPPAAPPPESPANSGSVSVGGRQARRRELARNRVYDAAISLITEIGFVATTMDMIAERADVARGTVFNHFPQKAEFLREWGMRRRQHVAHALAVNAAGGESASELLRGYLRELAALSVASRAETVQLIDAAARFGALVRGAPLAGALAEIVESGQAAGQFRTEAEPQLVGAVLASVYFSTVLRWIAVEPAPFALAEQLDAMLAIVFEGLVTDAATDV